MLRHFTKTLAAFIIALYASFVCACILCTPVANATPLAFNQQTVSCGTASTTLLAAGSAAYIVRVHVPTTAANPVFVNWAGAAATTAPPSEDIAAGASVTWDQFSPSAAITCIAAAATSVVIEWR